MNQNEKHAQQRSGKAWEVLGDFTATPRLLPISALAVCIGAVAAFVALALLRLIGLFTNLFYFERWSTTMVSPVGNHLGIYSVLVPIGGAPIISVVGRFGSGGDPGRHISPGAAGTCVNRGKGASSARPV